MPLSPKQTIIHGLWMESPNPATSTWTRQVAVCSPCHRRTPWASLRSTRAACLTAWTLRWPVGPSLPALDLQPPRAARPLHWLPVAPRRLRALQRRRLRRRRLRRPRPAGVPNRIRVGQIGQDRRKCVPYDLGLGAKLSHLNYLFPSLCL